MFHDFTILIDILGCRKRRTDQEMGALRILPFLKPCPHLLVSRTSFSDFVGFSSRFRGAKKCGHSYLEVLLINATYKISSRSVKSPHEFSTPASVSLIQKMRMLMYGRFNAYPIFSALEGASRRKLLLAQVRRASRTAKVRWAG
jgi:hypothetical protein